MRPTAEDLVDASSRWLHGQAFGAAGPAYVNFNKDTWEKSKAWDFAQSNHQAIWDAELEKEPLKEAAVVAKTDPERAFRIWSMLAEVGSVWSMYETARCHLAGEGIAEDAHKAEQWYRLASEQGFQYAMLMYSHCLAFRGDFAACEAALCVGAENDWAPARFWLALNRIRQSKKRESFLRARPELERAAEQGHPAAQWLFAKYMALGRFGFREIPRGMKLIWNRAITREAELQGLHEERTERHNQ